VAGEEMNQGRWMPRERWDALVRGEGCPLCEAMEATELVDAYGTTIADLGVSRLRLAANQFSPGYCVLICARHVREPYDLADGERAAFFEDMMRAARALERVYQPTKMNFEIMGNAVPHLHCHIVPRYYGDPVPGRPLRLDLPEQTTLLAADEYAGSVERIRAALV
jgi:diadenosine tetraphosphate (Ap4A) HIT family hydrolase